MANAVFTTKVNPVYDDLPELRYHFPKTYLNQAKESVGSFIIYYEPRREGKELSGRAGRKCTAPCRAHCSAGRVTEFLFDR
jgi:putative restriction endonuclease